MTNNSDYNKPRTRLNDLVSEVFKSETSEVLFENAFNRFLTKNETTRIAGYIGEGNKDAIVKRQLREPTVHRQAAQLQPLIYSKIGAIEHIYSWYDLLNQLERLGIDISRLPQWGDMLQFNWVPPIDLDKLVNFQDYYWYDEDAPNSRAEYITIKNRCTTADGYVNFWRRLIDEYGETIPIVQITESDEGSPTQYDQFVLSGDYTRIFESGFQMYVRNSSNAQINRQVIEVVNSAYFNDTNTTVILFDDAFTDNTVGGAVISLTEQYAVALVTRDCICGGGTAGWDDSQWDDNPATPVMWDDGTTDHAFWLASVSNPVAPMPGDGPVDQDDLPVLWYDTAGDDLYEKIDPTTWVQVISTFSSVLENTTGTALWDEGDCGTGVAIPAALQWVTGNKWLHKTNVPNFTIAKRAQFPIIEYNADLELNEWTYTAHKWTYRAGTFASWETSTLSPGLIELIPFDDYTVTGNTVKFAPTFGDQTKWFVPGRTVIAGPAAVTPQLLTVAKSYFAAEAAGDEYSTFVEFEQTIVGTPSIEPVQTIHGDTWRGYNVHWVYEGSADVLPVNHQVENPLLEITSDFVVSPSGDYEFAYGLYGQNNITLVNTPVAEFALDPSLYVPNGRALVGFDDVRVYVNNVRQFGTYDELGDTMPSDYVTGIRFLPGFEPLIAGTEIRIELGESAISDMGWANVPVRTSQTDDSLISLASLVEYRKSEQVKTTINQYPLFDIYNVDGTSAFQANPIFAYQTSPAAELQPLLGLRLVLDTTIRNCGFVQYLISEDNGTLFAYRSYDNQSNTYWYNTATNEVNTWNGITWSNRFFNEVGADGMVMAVPTVGPTMPAAASGSPASDAVGGLVGHLWYDTTNNVLRRRTTDTGNNITNDWTVILSFAEDPFDQSLQTIWRKGLYNERYIPAKVDWVNRTEEEYNAARDLYIYERAQELELLGTSPVDAEATATTEWFDSQKNNHSPTGDWTGDWEIPDPLYFNNQHENRKILTYRELVTHFNTIINAQPKIPGFAGPRSSMFHLIPPGDVNYGVGGRIKEFNDGFDTFLSSTFVDNINPVRLIQFARDQYNSLLNSLSDSYRRNIINLLTDTSTSSLSDFTSYVTDFVVTQFQQSDSRSFVYGDSTTFTDVDGLFDVGIRNWIATLPYLRLASVTTPIRLIDDENGIDQIVHHDGHMESYIIPATIIETTSRAVVRVIDPRSGEPFGKISNQSPPSTFAAFETAYGSIENREGVLWYHVPPTGERVLYRFAVTFIGTQEPPASSSVGTYWFDTADNQLKVKDGAGWDPTDFNDAWVDIDFTGILNSIILDVETRLQDNVPSDSTVPYDLDNLNLIDSELYKSYLEAEFLSYASDRGIIAPYRNSNYEITDEWTWNYKNSPVAPADQPLVGATETVSGGDWRDLYQKLYGTPYPHLEPWVLQSYTSKPSWWDEEYADALVGSPVGSPVSDRRWTTEMWTNILAGTIPAGREYPNGVTADLAGLNQLPAIPAWNYVSVNWNGSPATDDLLSPVGTVYATGNDVVAPGADFSFGDSGPIEWEWRVSGEYRYALMIVAYRLDPVRFTTRTFGKDFYIVGGLQIDTDTNNTFSHTRTDFHGEVVNNLPYLINGTNQWYVNFNRYAGFDSSYSNFRTMWTNWTAPLTYQMSSFIDTDSFILGHRVVDITPFDWKITSKQSPGVEDFWYDAFKVSLLEMPPAVARYNNEAQWVFELNTNLPISRTIQYYDVKNYQFHTDPVTDICSIYTYNIISIDTVNNRFGVLGDQTKLMSVGRTFDVSGSTANDGTYTVVASAFDASVNQTYVVVEAGIDGTSDGLLQLNYRAVPWNTGDRVFLTTNETLPTPLLDQTEYFVIVLNDRQFRLARTPADAMSSTYMDLTTAGRRNHFVGQLNSTFRALEGTRTSTSWRHYEVDKDNILSLTLPTEFSGIQALINLVDGYEQYKHDEGWRINSSGELKDPVYTERNAGWQLELERFIDYVHGIRTQVRKPNSILFEVSLNDTTDTLTFVEQYAEFLTGDPVIFSSDNGILPPNIIPRIKYYVVRNSLNEFKVAGSRLDADQGITIDIDPVGSPGYNKIWVSPATRRAAAITSVTLNPFRNGIWFRPDRGIVSNILTGPTEDLQAAQLIFDQYGRPLGKNRVRVYRQDKETHIAVPDGINNDVEITAIFNDPYNFIHIGGVHLFVDTYEHVLMFNNYNTEQQLLYDPFVGLNVTKYEVLFRRQIDFTQRPNVGGYYLNIGDNQEVQLKRNIEASIEDMRYLYDTNVVPETETLILSSRQALGYEGRRDYFNNLNVGPKSQFLFWKGMIQQKGSLNAVNAFINSRRFLDAKIDEFWAVKLADFGSAGEKEYPELFLTTQDARSNDIRFEFVIDTDLCLPGYAINTFDQDPCGFAFPNEGDGVLLGSDGFTPITLSDENRWYNQPDQLETLRNNGNTLYFTMKPIDVIDVQYITGSPDDLPSFPENNDTVIIEEDGEWKVLRWNTITQNWDAHGGWDPLNEYGALPVIRHSMRADTVEITLDIESSLPRQEKINDQFGNDVTVAHAYIPFASGIKVHRHRRVAIANVNGSIFPDPTCKEGPDPDPALASYASVTVAGDQSALLTAGMMIAIQDSNFITRTTATVCSVTPVGSPVTETVIGLTQPLVDTYEDGSPIYGSPSYGNYNYISFGRELISGADFAETIPSGGGLLSNTIQLPDPVVSGEELTITASSAVLTEGVHFNMVNADVVDFIYPELIFGEADGDIGSPIQTYTITNLRIWGFTQDDNTQDPAKIIDVVTNTVITQVPMWDPARGLHYYNSKHNIDLFNSVDPARYNNTLLLTQPIEPGEGFTRVAPSVWTKEQVGTTWIDTLELDYVRYYDRQAIPDLDTRLNYWGRPADWATTTVYEWVESDVPPEEWNELASLEENDGNLPESNRKAGRVFPRLFKTSSTGRQRYRPVIVEYDVAVDGAPVLSNSPSEISDYDISLSTVGDDTGIVFPVANVVGGDPIQRTFIIEGDFLAVFFIGDSIQYQEPDSSSTIDFVIEGMEYDSTINQTTVTVVEPVGTQINATVLETTAPNVVVLQGNLMTAITPGYFITISGMQDSDNNQAFRILDVAAYDAETNTTSISIDGVVTNDQGVESPGGQLLLGSTISGANIIHGGVGFQVGDTFRPSGGSVIGNDVAVLQVSATAPFITFQFDADQLTNWFEGEYYGGGAAIFNNNYDVQGGTNQLPVAGPAVPGFRLQILTDSTSPNLWNPNDFGPPNLAAEVNRIIVIGANTFPANGNPAVNVFERLSIRINGGQWRDYYTNDVNMTTETVPGSARFWSWDVNVDSITVGDFVETRWYTGGDIVTSLTVIESGQYSDLPNTPNNLIPGGDNPPAGEDGPIVNLSFTSSIVTPGSAQVGVVPNYDGTIRAAAMVGSEFEDIGVYVNGFKIDQYSFIIMTSGSPPTSEIVLRIPTNQIKYNDHVTVSQSLPNQERIQEGLNTRALIEAYEYTSVNYIDRFGQTRTKYYFWVRDKGTRGTTRSLSPLESQRQLISIPTPYIFFQGIRRPARAFVDGHPINLPLRFSQSVIKGLRGIVNADRRYVLRYTRDYTLRDSLDHGTSPLQLKNQHTEWELIREEQPSKIRKALWNLVTECIIGEKLDGSIRIPSLTRELYDTKFQADTQYGLGRDQAIANGELALAAILYYLTNPENDFRPIDINIFFQQYSFDGRDNIVAAMNRIYDAFAAIHVNKIFFSVLHDAAFSQKNNYIDIFKTSMIALHGVKPFLVGGLLDD